ncbi:MAG: hypothetical protein ACRCVD_08380 [Halioglobus sp.]
MTYISDIDPATPTGQDLVLNGDNQLRALKSDIRATLGGLNGPVMQDADTAGAGGTVPVSAATMSSWEARIKALEQGGGSTSPVGAAIPVGGIVVWYGDLGTIPTGFKQCNGASYRYSLVGGGTAVVQTPDLRGRAIFGPGAANGPVWNQGSPPNWQSYLGVPYVDATTVAAGAHTHQVNTPSHALSVAEIPNHAHAMFADVGSSAPLDVFLSGPDVYPAKTRTGPTGDTQYEIAGSPTTPTNGVTAATGSSAGHTHPAATSGSGGSHTHTVGVNPPYLGLYHIMYVADGVPA